MTFRLVGDGSAVEEGIASFLCGMLFGATTVAVGHPLDTVKTRMQADLKFSKFSTLESIVAIYREGGIKGFYRGYLPPLMGSTFFRSIQFAAFGATMGYCRDEASPWRTNKFGGVEARVFLGGALAGIARSVLEGPLDVLKTRRQTGSSLKGIALKELTSGLTATMARNTLLLTIFFVCIDKLSATMEDTRTNALLRGGIATTAAWTLVWPLDVTKSRMQAVTGQTGANMRTVFMEAAREGALYRGYAAGIARSFFANGASLVAYQWGQQQRIKYFESRKM